MTLTDPDVASIGRGDWIQTYTGGKFYPLAPIAEEINPYDIAHALSMLCRFGGHVQRFYSVAEHSLLLSFAVPPEQALRALLHDASEAYLVDLPRPIKGMLPDYRKMEDGILDSIGEYFSVQGPIMTDEVREADSRILLNERAMLLPNTRHGWPSVDHLEPLPGVEIQGLVPGQAEHLFLIRLHELWGGIVSER